MMKAIHDDPDTMLISVLVHGSSGRVGQEVIKAVCEDPKTRLAGAVDIKVPGIILQVTHINYIRACSNSYKVFSRSGEIFI